MKSAAPWSIKGIEREARETAKIEARKSGKTLGQWLNKVIKENGGAASEDSDEPAQQGSGHEDQFDNDVHTTLNTLAGQMARLSNDQGDPDQPSETEPEDEEQSVIRILRDLTGKFEQSERQTSETLSEFKDDLNLISHYIHPHLPINKAIAETRSGSQKSPEMKTMEDAMELVVDHIELTDRRNGGILKSIQSRLSEIGDSMNSLPHGLTDEDQIQNQDRIEQMEERVGQLATRLDHQENQENSDSYLALEEKIARLGQDTLDQINNPPHMKDLHEQMAALSQGLEEVKSTPKPDKEISSLHTQYKKLAGRINETERHIPDAGQVNSIEERLQDLAGRLEQSLENKEPHPLLAELESRVNDLALQLEGTEEKNRWDDILPQLDAKFDQINNRLIQTEEKFKVLDGFKGRIDLLFKGLDKARETATETARQAADQAAQQVAEQVVQQATRQAVLHAGKQANEIARKVTLEANESTKTAVVEAAELAAVQAVAQFGKPASDNSDIRAAVSTLERGFEDVRTNSDIAEIRTQESLKNVQDSLEKVVERLSGLETRTAAPPEYAEPEISSPPTEPGSEPEMDMADLRLPPIDETFNEIPSSTEDAPELNDSLEQIYGSPQDPGYGAPMEAPHIDDEPLGGVSRNEDFIAAARRAAKTAAQKPSHGDEAAIIFQNVKDEDASKLGSLITRHRKSLLYAGIAVLAVGGLYMLGGMFVGGDSAPEIATINEEPVSAGPVKELAATTPPAPGVSELTPTPGISELTPTPGVTELTPAPGVTEPVQPVKGIAANKPAPADTGPTQPPVVSGPPGQVIMPLPGADLVAAPGPVNTPLPIPASTNSIPPEKPVAAAPKPLHMALGNLGGSSVKLKTVTAPKSTGNLPAALGSEELRAAAVAGNPMAQYEIAYRYATGKSVPKDMKKAKGWYQKAASRGFALAQYRLGTLFEKGQGVKKDLSSARIWYKQAAGKGNRKAMHNLAVLNAEGGVSGAKPNFKKAAQWFRKAAMLGLTDSQFNLAILSERGLGVPQSQIDAYKWFALAAANGDKDATNRLDTIANRMDSKTLVKARLEIKSWKSSPVNSSANSIIVPAGGWGNAKAVAPLNASAGELIMQAQSMLMALGYKPGPADGMMGGNTRQAIIKFQSNEGLAATGDVTPDLVARLKAASS